MAKLYFQNVTLNYPLYSTHNLSLRNQLIRLGTGGRIVAEAGKVNVVTALKDASFELNDGDRVGLIGHNGAGKTTLLRTMAGIYYPTHGHIERVGSLATVFDLGAGMDAELSGYENIFRVSLLMGFTRAQVMENMPEIEEFTELGDFLKLPVNTYSSGMIMRLMFAVATSARPEILLIDEMFQAGDASFLSKSHARILSLLDSAKIVVFASHSHKLLREYCNRILMLDHGLVEERGMDSLSIDN